MLIRYRAPLRRAFRFTRNVLRRLRQDRVTLAAGAISFFTLLSLIPLLLLGVSLAAFFTTVGKAQQQISAFTTILGPTIARVLEVEVLSVVRNRGVLTSVAVVFGLWSGSQVFIIIESAINQAWHVIRQRPFWMRRTLALFMVLIIGTLFVGAIGLINLLRILDGLHIPFWNGEKDVLHLIVVLLVSTVLPILLIFAIFTALYRLLPMRRVTVRSVMPGALVAALLWFAGLHCYGWYASHLADFSILYGSLGGMVLLLLLFYYNAFIMLLGAEISAEYHFYLLAQGDDEERQAEDAAWPVVQ